MNDGILLIDKPEDWTSFDVVAKVRGILQQQIRLETGERRKIKVGHAGTLDPFATGLLIILVGKATKQADKLLKQDKTYEAEFVLGATSNTDDKDGEIVASSQQLVASDSTEKTSYKLQDTSYTKPNEQEIIKALKQFTGSIQQVPPQFSAIKVGGKRAYKSARQGEHIDLKARPVTIKKLELINYKYPNLQIECDVSTGTYIRSLARDIGESLNTGSYVNQLRRTQVGNFSINNAHVIHELNYDLIQKSLLPLD